MSTLIHYELKKILKRKSSWVTLLTLLVCVTAITLVFVSDQYYYSTDGEALSGFEAIAAEKEATHAVAGQLTPDKLEDILERYQTTYENPQNYSSEGWLLVDIYAKSILPYRDILNLMRNVYTPETIDLSALTNVGTEQARNLYMSRQANIEETLRSGHYTSEEKETILKLNDLVSKHITFDYLETWKTLLNKEFVYLFLMLPLVVCIIISPIFANEYQTGADALILSSKNGRGKTVCAKICAGLALTSMVYVFSVLFCTGMVFSIFGIYGWDCDFQMLSFYSFYGLKVWQVFLLGIIINYIMILAVMAFAMLLSAMCKTPFAAVIISTLCTAAPFFFPANQSSSLAKHIINLFPVKAMNTSSVFASYDVYSIGKLVVTLPSMIIIVAIVLIAFTLPIAHKKFCKHQVV